MLFQSADDCATAGAAVLTDIQSSRGLKMQYEVNGVIHRLFEKSKTRTVVYKGLSQAAAEDMCNSADYNSDSRSYSDWQPGLINFVGAKVSGTTKTARASRVGDSRTFEVAVVEITFSTEEA